MAALISEVRYRNVKETKAQASGEARGTALQSVIRLILPLLKPAA